MSIFLEIMKEELERNLDGQKSILLQLDSLPKGYLSRCCIDDKVYIYRKKRVGKKIVSEYIGVPGDEKSIKAEEDRKQYLGLQRALRSLKSEEKKLRRAIKSYE